MIQEQWHRIKPVVQAALELEPEQRIGYVTKTIGDDPVLLREAESLLRTYENLGDFIEAPVFVGRIELNPPVEEDLIGRRFGPYEIVRELGRGGMGAVYLARDSRLGRRVAIKLLPGSISSSGHLLRRFQREAHAISQLNHPNILTIHEIESSGTDEFIVTEFVEGETVRERLSAGPVSVSDALDICLQTAGALAAAHSNGIVHRDIKPENLMIRRDGLVKVLDFGIAKLLQQTGEDSSDLTLTGADRIFPLGTPRYMSPEQMRVQEVDARTDIWSLGCVLHEMLTGSSPFAGATTSDVIVSVLEREPTRLPEDLSPTLRRVIERALKKDRELRYASIEEMSADLRDIRNELLEKTPAAVQTPDRRRGRFSLPAVIKLATAAAVIVLIGVLYLFFWSDARARSKVGTKQAMAAVHQLTDNPAYDSQAQFSPDGSRIVFTSNRDGGAAEIFVMNADGSSPERLTNNSVEDLDPTFSPDGKQIAFASRRGERTNIFVMAADGTDERQITDGINAYDPAWSPDGTRILFRIEENKANDVDDRIDLGKELKLCVMNSDGTRRQCLQSGPWDCAGSWSPDGTQIVFSSKRDATVETNENAEIYLMKADGSDVRRLTNLPESHDINATFSPEGTHIVFTSAVYGVGRIHRMRVDGSQLELVADANTSGSSDILDWSPDGTRLLISRTHQSSDPDIYSIAAPPNTSRVDRVTSFVATEMMADLSRDGSEIVFVSDREGENKIYIMNADGSGVRRLTNTEFNELSPAWSPDASRVAFEHGGTGKLQIYVVGRDGSDIRQITDHPGGCGRAAWSPDGEWLAFQCGLHPVTDIYVAHADGSDNLRLTPLMNDKYFDGDPTWSPDGTRIAFTSSREIVPGAGGIFIMNRDGSDIRQLTEFPAFNATPDWSPDGNRIVFKSNRDGNFELYLINVDGSGLERITNNVATDGEPEWSADGRSIVFDSRRHGNREIYILRLGTE